MSGGESEQMPVNNGQAPAGAWRNRIIGHAELAPSELLANPLNFRTHPAHQQAALAGVLGEVGLVQAVIVNQQTGNLIDGHLRVALALRDGQASIPVTLVDLAPAEERQILATFDPIGALAGADVEILDSLLRSVTSGDTAVQALLGSLADTHGLVDLVPADDDLWQGMPDFEQEAKPGYKSLTVHFETEDDYTQFQQAIDQKLTVKTRFIWYPAQVRQDLTEYRCDDDEPT